MASRGIAARVGLIGAVSVIVGVSTLSPLLKQPSPATDTGALVAFAPSLPNQGSTEPSATPAASEQPSNAPTFAASTAAAAGDTSRAALLTAAPPATPVAPLRPGAPAVTTMQLPSDENAAAAPQAAGETPQPPPIVAATEPPKAEKRARTKRSAYNTRRARQRSTPFSYSQQLAAH
jgi:hypothetical protein